MTDKTDMVANRIFNRLAIIYPAWHAASKHIGPDIFAENYKSLLIELLIAKKVTDLEAVKVALGMAMRRAADGEVFLPSAAMFVKWCKGGAAYHKPFKETKRIPVSAEARARSAQIKAWYSRRISEINRGEPVDLNDPQPWTGGIQSQERPGDETLKGVCGRMGAVYFHPDGEVSRP